MNYKAVDGYVEKKRKLTLPGRANITSIFQNLEGHLRTIDELGIEWQELWFHIEGNYDLRIIHVLQSENVWVSLYKEAPPVPVTSSDAY
ncbi:MAG: hypothetical protein MPJ05_06485 [Nitrosopumilus sp.]|nr:hypothetical protein [Nitrosopumilus sp.]MDA7997616.1 hypothetical protein [Nitrosopumilus sp.]CAI9832443.1 hypothetical protein IBTHAUMO2_780013 [Nitrosopumilaceae archaeon]